MINPLDVAKEIKAMADVLAGGRTLDNHVDKIPTEFHMNMVAAATELWEKVYAINHCPNCDMEDPEDAWKHGNPEHDPENN